MLFGISLSCRAEKFSRALSMAEELAHRHPEPPAYVALLECLILAGRRKEAIAVRDFLQFVVRYEDDAANRQSITAALQKESVRAL
jgi:hypothetical protein